MPYITLQVDQSGALMLGGVISISAARLSALNAANLPVPPPVSVRAMVDTGASCTCVDPSVLTNLGLTPTGMTSALTPSTGSQPVQLAQYDVNIVIYARSNAEPPLVRPNLPVVAAQLLASQGFHVLLGRDILGNCLLTYHGHEGLFSLCF